MFYFFFFYLISNISARHPNQGGIKKEITAQTEAGETVKAPLTATLFVASHLAHVKIKMIIHALRICNTQTKNLF